jgi:L-amino acid N-acyltransferase YncA
MTVPVLRHDFVAGPVMLRLACEDDSERVWEWNFAPDVRARSVSTHIVTFAKHQAWFAKRLAKIDSPIWIVEENKLGVGVVRLDQVPGYTKISIALTQTARGRGVGKKAIAAACKEWGKPIVAEIQPDNHASRLCFEACGFTKVATTQTLLTYRWTP